MADLSVNIGELQMKNPVMTASGTFGYSANRLYHCKGDNPSQT